MLSNKEHILSTKIVKVIINMLVELYVPGAELWYLTGIILFGTLTSALFLIWNEEGVQITKCQWFKPRAI